MKTYQKPEAEFISLIMQEEITAEASGAEGSTGVESAGGVQWQD